MKWRFFVQNEIKPQLSSDIMFFEVINLNAVLTKFLLDSRGHIINASYPFNCHPKEKCI